MLHVRAMSLTAASQKKENQQNAAELQKLGVPATDKDGEHHDMAIDSFSEKCMGYGPSSPSPRAVETWGPCSPFTLPSPSTQITLIEPEEISLILDSDGDGRSGTHIKYNENKGVALPKNGFNELETILEASELQFPLAGRQENQITLLSDIKMGDISITACEESDKFLEELLSEVKTDCIPENGGNQPSPINCETKSPNLLENTTHDGVSSLKNKVNTIERQQTEGKQACKRVVHGIHLSNKDGMGERKTFAMPLLLGNNTEAYQQQPEHKSGHQIHRRKNTYNSSSCESPENTNNKLENVNTNLGEHLTEEELKRIRRVKNRASVEKCRNKQRLRMEALQTELTTLTSENEALRDLTIWMDSSVDAISSQLADKVPSLESFSGIRSSSSVSQADEQVFGTRIDPSLKE